MAAVALILLVFVIAQPVMANDKFYTNERVNLRTGPSTDHDRLRTLSIGTEVTVLEHDVNEWSKVVFRDQTGYIKSEFLDSNRPENAPNISPSGVVMMEWSQARNVVKPGTTISMYDVRSGLTYNVRSFSTGAHADVVTLTAQDTETMKRTFGNWTWCPRPVWVTIGDVTIAAAINGMPHGGGALPGTEVSGHFCLHFKGSSVHNGNRSYNNDVQAAVQSAFNAAQ